MDLNTIGQEPQIVYDGVDKGQLHNDIVLTKITETMDTGINMNNTIPITTNIITQEQLNTIEGNNSSVEIPMQSPSTVSIAYTDIYVNEKAQVQDTIAKANKNIFKKDQPETNNVPYAIFLPNEPILFNDETIKYLQNNYSNNGILIDCSIVIPNNNEQASLITIFITVAGCIEKIYSVDEFSIVTDTASIPFRFEKEEDIQSYLNVLETTKLFDKFL